MKHLPLLTAHQTPPSRAETDRLDLLTALINGPSFTPLFRTELIDVPRGHPVYAWECVVPGCEHFRGNSGDLCSTHQRQWKQARDTGTGKAAFLLNADQLAPADAAGQRVCRICLVRPATDIARRLCNRHKHSWFYRIKTHGAATDYDDWLSEQHSHPGFGRCCVVVCSDLAQSSLGLCAGHESRYRSAGRPGGAHLLGRTGNQFTEVDDNRVVVYADELTFRRWCAEVDPIPRANQFNLRGLRPLLRAEFQWGLFAHTQGQHSQWGPGWLQTLVNFCRRRDLNSLTELDLGSCTHFSRLIAREILNGLRLVYFGPEDTRDAGFIETDHFGVRFPNCGSYIDLTVVSQRWLRNMLWDHLAAAMRSPHCPRSSGVFANLRRASAELSAFLQAEAPGHGDDPTRLGEEHMLRFVTDQRHRATHGLPSLSMKKADGTAFATTQASRRLIFNHVRRLLRTAMDSGETDRIGLDRGFVIAAPSGGKAVHRTRTPFSDEVAHALADEANLQQLAHSYDPQDQGLRDIWETIIVTGRRANEAIGLRWDCLGRHGDLPMLWHDQTKVGNYDQAIRIPEGLYQRLRQRQRKTLDRFVARHGRPPTDAERRALALFPTRSRNLAGQKSLSYSWFSTGFKQWIAELNLGTCVPHQARHTLATTLLRHGASLTHIRRYLGQVSDRMAEHYTHVAVSEIEDVLQHVWVAGPAAPHPGELLSGDTKTMSREQAHALAIDLSRRSTPAEGGFCTFQPVVNGDACPWKLDCHNCDKFVLSGADLLYWRRKREQWRSIAERAPDDATADYLHQVFEPTGRAIDGLEKALAGMGLLDEALALDLRRPQDYFHRIWSLSFRATELADASFPINNGDSSEPQP
ncbi:tyrosine-type recombinase/integrase [Amycolatopsis albispora]|uniref:Integrase n=1 Tax=Amycolatopsis albispora TaxID=1804986 RepID=A0A344LDU4_9PSEU|nr:tyrosine-type recombinase/integrase [Amycolatopsis albispora]AXB43677.1 integrase [Amycolatopsis albispora]AXB46161.1 integrase [Amycolatopsis albispora]AXB46218.1 integrase [Amycolatopsis albispora]